MSFSLRLFTLYCSILIANTLWQYAVYFWDGWDEGMYLIWSTFGVADLIYLSTLEIWEQHSELIITRAIFMFGFAVMYSFFTIWLEERIRKNAILKINEQTRIYHDKKFAQWEKERVERDTEGT